MIKVTELRYPHVRSRPEPDRLEVTLVRSRKELDRDVLRQLDYPMPLLVVLEGHYDIPYLVADTFIRGQYVIYDMRIETLNDGRIVVSGKLNDGGSPASWRDIREVPLKWVMLQRCAILAPAQKADANSEAA